MSRLSVSLLLAGLVTVIAACSDEPAPQSAGGSGQMASEMVAGGSQATGSPRSRPAGEMISSAAGTSWNVPDRWTVQETRPMRVATYNVAPASGDTTPGECAIFFFGTGEGGSVDMNLARWKSQFEGVDGQEAELIQKSQTVNGLKVTTTSISGTYLAAMGPMFQSGAAKSEGHKMLGAIISAPEGNVFIKFTGPEKTIDAAAQEFNDMILSVRKR